MARPRKLIKRAARRTATSIGYTRAQAKAYARGAVQAIKPEGVTTTSKTYRKQIGSELSKKQRVVVRKFDRG